MDPLFINLLAPPAWPDLAPGSRLQAPRSEPGAWSVEPGAASEASAIPAFGEVMSRFLGQVNKAQGDADDMVEALALGEPVDVHQVMLALNEAGAALQMTLQVRGKLLDAYQELMRTQI